ncbi:MAG: hypothetical protein WD824_07790 [Cyclobacteriaceae bacterium]
MILKNNIGTALTLILTLWLGGCAFEKEKSRYDKLVEYEGKFEYFNGSSLILSASELDTTLYAILDEAKYPLRYVSADTFTDVGKDSIIFYRDEEGRIKSYQVRYNSFMLYGRSTPPNEMIPGFILKAL